MQKTRKKIANTALALKLLVRCWAMLRHNQPWNPNLAEPATATEVKTIGRGQSEIIGHELGFEPNLKHNCPPNSLRQPGVILTLFASLSHWPDS
jgi:hypothetical protein